MRYKFKYIHLLLPLFLLLAIINAKAQYPGGVSTGITRGYKVDNYNGTFSDQTGFGAGTSNATPTYTGYSNKITGTEFNNIRADYYGMEYTGTLEIPTTGNYTFGIAGDDRIWLYIDNSLVAQANYSNGTQTATVNLAAGDHTIKVKFYEVGGPNNATLQVSNGPVGSNITTATNVDGRFVRYEGAKLSAWYKASDLSVTPNYGGAGIDKVNIWTNKAPDYTGNGNMPYNGSGGAGTHSGTLVNFNPGVRFDGDDSFRAGSNQKALSYRGATKSMFMVNQYISNVGQSGIWMFHHGDNNTAQRVGLSKTDANNSKFDFQGSSVSGTSTYTANEPKLLSGFLGQTTGATASSTTNPATIGINGIYTAPIDVTSNLDADSGGGLGVSSMNAANFPEAIYYPFELSATERQKVNSYLAIKYGITLAQDYVNTSGATVFGLTTNAGYTNRIFGIGQELAVEALSQRQSQSQMTSATGYDFLKVSKGALAATNAANTGTLADGDYLLLGDNNGALSAQTTEIPTSFATAAGCTVNRFGREWKAQVTGAPGAITLVAGSTTTGSYVFPNNAAGITLLVDTDGDGDFTTGTVTAFPATSVVNGVATFNNVTVPNGAVITFGWTVIAPGGVSNGLTHWYNNTIGTYSDAAATTSATDGDTFGSWTNTVAPTTWKMIAGYTTGSSKYYANGINFNPAWGFNNYIIHNSGTADAVINTGTVSTFLAVAPKQGNGNYQRRWAIRNPAANDWDNTGSAIINGENLVTNPTRAQFARNNTQCGYISPLASVVYGVPTVFSTVHSNTATSMYMNGGLGSSNTYNFGANNLNFKEMFLNGSWASSDGGWTGTSGSEQLYTEAIFYNRNLTATERQQVETYLSIKNGTTMAIASGANYLASDGTTNIYNKTTYPNNIFGIGRDDCSGLNQRQSKSTVSGDNLIVGLNAIATTNALNIGSFTTNKQFLMIGNDGGSLTGTTTNIPASYSALSCNPYRYVRNWKVQNTGNVTGLQITVGNSTNLIGSNWSNIYLAINSAGDATFATGTTTLVQASSISAGVATFNNVSLPDGALFTLCYTLGYPGGVSKPSIGTTIAGSVYVNGVAYSLYSTNGAVSRDLIASSLGSLGTDALLGKGYYNNISDNFETFFSQKRSTNYGIQITGKILASRTGNYQFRTVAPDDQTAFVINGITALNVTSATGSTITSVTTVSLTAGQYYDFTYICGASGSPNNFNLQWDGVISGTFAAISDSNLFVLPAGPSAWYEADDNILSGTVADGGVPTGWTDLSENNNNLVTTGTPNYYNTSATKIRNYNPVIAFGGDYMGNTGNYINGFGYGKQGKTLIGVADMFASGAVEILTGYGSDTGTNNGFRMLKGSGNLLNFEGVSNGLIGPAYYGATRTTNIIEGIYANGNITTTNNASIYLDNKLHVLGDKPLWNTTMNDNGQLYVAISPDDTNANSWTGSFSEILYYPWDLSSVERQKVNSYLSIKWGLTLDQTTATNYLDSNSSIIWNASTAGIYKNDITGIGRDDCGALYQKQSTSTDGNDIVSLGLGATGLAATNAANTNTFSTNKTFLMFAHNGVTTTSKTQTNMPSSLSNCYYRLQREWQVQATGTPGPVSIEIGKKGLLSINAITYKPVLLISNVAGNYTAATVVKYSSVANGKANFNNVTLTNGQYFTIAYVEAAPGGVGNNMTVWFNSDYDSFTDIAQDNYATNDGDKVASMNNIKFGATFSKVEQSNATYQPTYYKAAFNYNAGILFRPSGTQSALRSNIDLNSTDYRTTTSMTSIFAGYNLGTDTDPGPSNVFWYHGDGTNTTKTAMERPQAFWQGQPDPFTGFQRNPSLTSPEIYTYTVTANGSAGGVKLLSNLKNIISGTSSATASGNLSLPFYIGNNGDPASYTAGAKFYLGEFVIYSDDKSLNSYDITRAHSYLAIKYGYTLDRASLYNNTYIASNGTVIYNDANYWNRITGIGMDDCSALDQKQSFSQVTTGGAMIKISNDPNGLAASNNENTAEFSIDKSFLVFGDNNKSLTWNAKEDIKDPSIGTDLMRLNRVWRVKETGTVGTVYLQVPASTSTATVGNKLPAPNNTPGDPFYLIVANSASGGVFSNPTVVPMIPNGTDWTVTYDFTDGDYYTFATVESCLAPAGITDGLTTWYKTTDLPTGAIAATTGTLTDLSGSGNTLTRNASGTATATAGTATLFNYNRYVALSGNAVLQKSALSETSITAANQGSLYAVGLGTNNASLFGLSRSGYNGPGIFNTPSWANNNGTYGGTAVANVANIWNAVKSTTNLFGSTNGTLSSTANATNVVANSNYVLNIGSSYSGASQIFGNNTFSEAFSFNRELTTAEQQTLNTYLAIKYGQTLSHNYFAPDYNGTNAATTTLYDISTYSNRVFGVGNHIGGCFYQNQSTSSLTGSLLKISVDGILNTENSQDKTKWTVDRAYTVIGDDNGSLLWITSNKPYILANNTCVSRITRQWKVTTTNTVPALLVTIPDSTSSAATKLNLVPPSNDVYMVVSDQADFTSATATQQEIKMTLNATTKEWEANVTFDPNTTRYITFIYRTPTCGLPCVPVNPATSRIRIK